MQVSIFQQLSTVCHLHTYHFKPISLQIKILKQHYDKIVSADSQTGGKPYFEPSWNELIDCFTAIKDVSGGLTCAFGTSLVDTSKSQSTNGSGDGASNDVDTMTAENDEERKKGKGEKLFIYQLS